MSDSDVQITFGADATGLKQGADQAKAAVGEAAAKIGEFSKGVGELGESLKGVFDGLKSMAEGLEQAGKGGAEGLAGLAEVGSGLIGIAVGVAQAALSAAGAIAQWAAHAVNSNKASEDAKEHAAALNSAMKSAGDAFGNVGDTLANAFAPVLTTIVGALTDLANGFTASYNTGGAAKTLVDGLVIALKGLEAIVIAVVGGYLTFETALVDIGKVGVDSVNLVIAVVQGLWDKLANLLAPIFQAVETVASAAWNGIKSGFNALVGVVQWGYGLWQSMNQPLVEAIGAISTVFGAVETDVQNAIQVMIGWVENLANSVLNFVKSLPGVGAAFNTLAGDAKKSLNEVSTAAAATASNVAKAFGPDATAKPPAAKPPRSAPGGGGGQGGGKSQMDQWAADLKNSQLAAEAATGIFNADMSAGEVNFWEQKLKVAKQGSDLWLAIFAKLEPLLRAQQSSAAAAQATADKQALADRLKTIEGETNATVRGAQEQLTAQKAQIEDQIAGVKEAYEAGQITRAQEWSQIEALHERETQAAITAARAQYQAAADAMAQKAALGPDDIASLIQTTSDGIDLFARYWGQIQKLSADGHKQLENDDKASLADFKKDWDATVNPIVSSFTSGLLQMAEGTKTFAQVMSGIGQQLLNDWLKNIDKMIESWLWKEAGQTLATTLGITQRAAAEDAGASQSVALSGMTALKQVTNSAVKAAGEAYSALAGIPIIGPVLGAGAAAVTFAAVEAFGGLVASAAGGFDIPVGVNPLTQLHAEEMVLPARLANPMRDMLANVASGEGGVRGGGEAHNHTHNWSVTAMDGPSVEKFLRTHGDRMVKVLNERARANAGVTAAYAR